MIVTFKILRGFDNVDSQDWFTTYGANTRVTRTASYCLNIVPKHYNTDVRRNFFTNRVIECNAQRNSIKDSVSISSFKRNYDDLTGYTE